MSGENVEVVRAVIKAFNRGDLNSMLEHVASNFEFDYSRSRAPDLRGVYGRDQLREFWDEFGGNWESRRIEPHEFIEVGEHVVVPWTFHAVGRDGIDVRANVALTFTIHDGAIERIGMYQEREEALKAAGLSGVGDVAEEHLDTSRRVIDALNRRDLDAFLEAFDPEAELGSLAIDAPSTYRGHSGIREWWANTLSVFPDIQIEAVELRDFGDVGISKLRLFGHGAGSEAPFDETAWQVGVWREGKFASLRTYGSEAEANAAAGLSQ